MLLAALALNPGARGGDVAAGERHVLARDVWPILKAHCTKCHGPNKPKGKLNLSNPRSMARGGENGVVVVAGKLDESPLWDLVSDDEMPPEPDAPLSPDEKATLRRWIEGGAEGLPAAVSAAQDAPGADHWAFARSSRPAPPKTQRNDCVRGPIDAFIEKALEERGLVLGPDADHATLARRLSFDLIGLPPTPEEVDEFDHDPRPDAYERLVDRLMASPRYGERWGKYWLDASGHADSNGYFNADTDRPLAYRYRDYVVRALNADRPLDQIVRDQLAGDELAVEKRGPGASPETIDQLIATHYLRNAQDGTGESDGNPDERRADKQAVLEGTVRIIGSSLLGLTLQCAKCHDHKFEPITEKEYYQLQAVLYPAYDLEHWAKPNDRIIVAGPRAELSLWEARDKAILVRAESLKRAFITGSGRERKRKEKAIEPMVQKLFSQRRPNPGRIAWVSDVSRNPEGAPVLVRGNASSSSGRVGPGVPACLTDPDNPYAIDPRFNAPGARSTGRRLAFARWLTRPGSRPSALLARLLANRIWLRHFGEGLVATPDNLGLTGAPPSHPELLEFLASELARSDWSAKALTRLIVTSTAYRQSSAPAKTAIAEVDPEDRLLSRYPLRRLDAEALRDAMLAASDELDVRPFGPYVPTERTGTGEVVVAETTPGAHRRSIYLQQRRTQVATMLEVFDAPSIVNSCTYRPTSTVPLQSLSLLNSAFVAARASRLAERLEREVPSNGPAPPDATTARIARAFALVVGRGPSAAELTAAERFLRTQPARYAKLSALETNRLAWADFCQMLLASDAFLYVE